MNQEEREEYLDKKEEFEQSELAEVFPKLRRGVIHATPCKNFQLILDDGYIRPNDGSFPFTFNGASEASYAFFKGYISLFDFETPPELQCMRHHRKWSDILLREPNVLIQIDKKMLPCEPIPCIEAYKEVGYDKMFVPRVECWSPDPIPISTAMHYYFTLPEISHPFQELVEGRKFSRPFEHHEYDATREDLKKLQNEIKGKCPKWFSEKEELKRKFNSEA